MNSHQRRTNNRHWQHTVHLDEDTEQDKLLEIKQWCIDTYGRRTLGYKWSHVDGYVSFSFRHDKDAVLFALTWYE